MLSRTHRFHGYNSLNWAYRHGKTVRDPKLALKYALNTHRKTFRAAVVVSRKVSKSAVVRNKIRRRIYEILRPMSGDIKDAYDLIFSVYSDELAKMPQAELSQLVHSELLEAGVLGGES